MTSIRLGMVILFAFLAPLVPTGRAQTPASPPEAFGPAVWPDWARPIRFEPQAGKPWLAFPNSRTGTAGMKESVGRLRYALDTLPGEPDTPFYRYQQSRHLLDLDEDSLALLHLTQLIRLPVSNTPYRKTGEHPTLDDLIRDSRLLLARLYARRGLAREALAELGQAPVRSGYDAIRHAEVLVLLGDASAAAMLDKAKGGGHPEKNFSDVFLRLRAALLARASGRDSLVRTLAAPITAKGIEFQKWPQWKSSCAILIQVERQAQSGKSAAGPWKDGVYRGTSPGFDRPVEVSVRISGGRLEEVKTVSARESRPWSALDIIPARILRRQGLNVDAVTGATVTSCAILAAVDQALEQARP
jgi:uncharacterized protein with FMN-binding domain